MEFGILLFVLISILLLVKRLMVKKTAKAAAYLLLMQNASADKSAKLDNQDVIDSINKKVEDLFKNDIEEFKKLGMQYFDTLKDPNDAKKIVVKARDCGWNG